MAAISDFLKKAHGAINNLRGETNFLSVLRDLLPISIDSDDRVHFMRFLLIKIFYTMFIRCVLHENGEDEVG